MYKNSTSWKAKRWVYLKINILDTNLNTKHIDVETSPKEIDGWYLADEPKEDIRKGKKFTKIWTKINNHYAKYKKNRPCYYYKVNYKLF